MHQLITTSEGLNHEQYEVNENSNEWDVGKVQTICSITKFTWPRLDFKI
jgi:hypothetical protein